MATPTLALIPSGVKATKVYSVLPDSGNGDFTNSRASTATRINKDGLIESVAANVPRLNYDLTNGVAAECPSLLLELSRTNSFPYSEAFSNSDWTKTNTSITSNSIISPDGTLSASKLVEDTSNSTHRISDTIVVSGTGVAYSQSIFAKSGGNGRYLRMFRGSGTYNDAVFDLENGTVVTQGGSNIIDTKIEKYPNGWYRCISIYTTQFSNIATYYGLQNGGTDSYQGDGTSGIYIWGAQLEEVAFQPYNATSYIPTSGSTSTRSDEACYLENIDNGIFNSSAFTLYFETEITDNTVSNYKDIIALYDTAGSTNLRLETRTNSQVYIQQTGVVSSGTDFNSNTFGSNSTSFTKFAISGTTSQLKIYANGSLINTFNGTYVYDFDKIGFRLNNANVETIIKNKELRLYDTVLSDSEIQTLTTL